MCLNCVDVDVDVLIGVIIGVKFKSYTLEYSDSFWAENVSA